MTSRRPRTSEEIVDRHAERVGNERKFVRTRSGGSGLPVRDDRLVSAASLPKLRLRQTLLVTQASQLVVVERSDAILGHLR